MIPHVNNMVNETKEIEKMEEKWSKKLSYVNSAS